MLKNPIKIITISSFAIAIILIALLLAFRGNFQKNEKKELPHSKIIMSNPLNVQNTMQNTDIGFYDESSSPKIALGEGEILISTRTEDFDGDAAEEQIIIYRNLLQENNPVYFTYIDYDEKTKTYQRVKSFPTAITRPNTVSLYTQDLIGDRSNCVIISGLKGSGESVMTVFSSKDDNENPFTKIADITIDGTITIVETERSQAYHLGIAKGVPFVITARGRDLSSSNELDQIEITYSYNPAHSKFEQNSVTRMPGSQVAAKRLRELLQGGADEFEEFVEGLWYHVSSDGLMDNNRYIYFDIQERELIFYDEDTQQVYNWLSSSPTRYGLYVTSQNISVATLRRMMNIELESLESIQVKVLEDVRMKIGINAPWDGTYRKASSIRKPQTAAAAVVPFLDAEYNSSMGTVRFLPDGTYKIELSGSVREGKYAFFSLEGQELLELQSDQKNGGREIYRVIRKNDEKNDMSLFRVRLSTKGTHDFHEAEILLSKAG